MHTIDREEIIRAIDNAADTARQRIVGDPVRVIEYQVAEADAAAFKNAGYTGTVPPSIGVWAQAKGWTAQQAADDILAAAASWRQALIGLRQARLVGKEAVRNAADDAGANAAGDSAIAQIKYIQSLVLGS